MECFYCHRKGHYKRNYQKFQNNLRETKRQKEKTIVDQHEETLAIAQAAESKVINSDVLYTATGSVKILNDA